MKRKSIRRTRAFAGLAALLVTAAVAAKDRFTVVAANGIAFSEFRGYDTWRCHKCHTLVKKKDFVFTAYPVR